ncbi:DUF4097 family beta strand repeat-containing protein [Tessaracoccus sp. G1721]
MSATATLRRATFPASAVTTLQVWVQAADVTVRHEATDTCTIEVACHDEADLGQVEFSTAGNVVGVRVPPLLAEQSGRRGLAIDLGFMSLSLGDARARGVTVTAVVPEGASVQVESKSGDVVVSGRSARVKLRTGSGAVTIEEADEALLATGSGDVTAGRIHADGQVRSGSGDVRVRHSSGTLTAGTGSGDLDVALFDGAALTLRTASGDVSVGLPTGVPIWQDVRSTSGDLDARLEPAGQPAEGAPFITVRVTTASGDITLRNA